MEGSEFQTQPNVCKRDLKARNIDTDGRVEIGKERNEWRQELNKDIARGGEGLITCRTEGEN